MTYTLPNGTVVPSRTDIAKLVKGADDSDGALDLMGKSIDARMADVSAAQAAVPAAEAARDEAVVARNGAVSARTGAEAARDEAEGAAAPLAGAVAAIDGFEGRVASVEDAVGDYAALVGAPAGQAVAAYLEGTGGDPVRPGQIMFRAADYGATGNGTDQTAALNSALTAMQTRGGGVLLLDGDYVVSGSGILNRAGNIIIAGRPGTTIRPAAGMTGPLFQTSASFPRARLVFDGITFDLDNRAAQGLSINGDHIAGQPRFTDCHFRNIGSNGTGLLLANTVTPLMERCTFRTPGAPAGSGITIFRGGRDITVRDCEFHYMRDGLTVAGGSTRGDKPQIVGVKVTGCTFEGGWWLIKARMSGAGTYTATSLTDAGATFAGQGIAALDTVRAIVLLRSGSTTAGSGQQTQLFDTGANFTTAGVKEGHIIRVPGKWAVVVSVESATKLWHEGWQDSTTYEPTHPPAVGAAYTIHEPILGRITEIAANTLTIQHWHTLDGTVTTPANGTPYEVLVTKGNYPLHTEYGSYNVEIRGNTFKRGWSDQCSIYSNGVVIKGNLISDGQDMGITMQGRNASVSGNIIRHQGAGCIWAEESGHTIHDNELFDAPWQNVTDALAPLVFWNATACKGHDNVIHSTGATAAARSKYAVVVRGTSPSVELNDNTIVGAFSVAHYYYTGSGTNVRGRFGPGATFERPGGGTLRGEFRGNGAPSIPADVGSTYLREDGGSGSTMYVKETAWNSTTWRAI